MSESGQKYGRRMSLSPAIGRAVAQSGHCTLIKLKLRAQVTSIDKLLAFTPHCTQISYFLLLLSSSICLTGLSELQIIGILAPKDTVPCRTYMTIEAFAVAVAVAVRFSEHGVEQSTLESQ